MFIQFNCTTAKLHFGPVLGPPPPLGLSVGVVCLSGLYCVFVRLACTQQKTDPKPQFHNATQPPHVNNTFRSAHGRLADKRRAAHKKTWGLCCHPTMRPAASPSNIEKLAHRQRHCGVHSQYVHLRSRARSFTSMLPGTLPDPCSVNLWVHGCTCVCM